MAATDKSKPEQGWRCGGGVRRIAAAACQMLGVTDLSPTHVRTDTVNHSKLRTDTVVLFTAKGLEPSPTQDTGEFSVDIGLGDSRSLCMA